MKPAMSICLIVFLVSAAAAQQTSADSLYKRLGGCDAITAVTDDFIGRLGTDPSVARFFTGHSTDSKQRLRKVTI
jgi:hemoglobin